MIFKAKIIAVLVLLLGVIVGAAALWPANAHAVGETYTWVDSTTIQGGGGRYVDWGVLVDFKDNGSGTYTATIGGKACDLQVTITPTAGSTTKAHLAAQRGCVAPPLLLDTTIAIGHPERGPIDYIHANCDDTKQSYGDKTKCAAIKACATTAGKALGDCRTAYETCISNHTDNGKISDEDKKKCVAAVTAGDLATATSPSSGTTSCVIQGIGWIVCPVVNFLALIMDGTYQVVGTMLTVQPLLTTGQSKDIYRTWQYMRTFANVVFVVAFLLIIFSQITSIGVSNYGIKRLLPRLIIAAVLVNASYWICAVCIDVSNILGAGVDDLFHAIKVEVAPPKIGVSGTSTAGGWQNIAGGVVAGTIVTGIALYVGLSALLPILITALLTVLTIFLVLAVRQAFILLLIVVSPLAFVAYLLPGTESWFKRWREMFQALLLLYPIIGLIFGGSALASQIIINGAPGSGGAKLAVQILGAGVAVLPLVLVPVAMKGAGRLMQIGGIVNNPNRGPFDRMRRAADKYQQDRASYRGLKALNGVRTLPLKGVAARRRARRDAVLNNRQSEMSRANAAYVSSLASGNPRFRGQLARGSAEGADMRALATAMNTEARIEADEVSAATAVIRSMNLSREQLRKLAEGGEAAGLSGATNFGVRQASIQRVIDTRDNEGVNKLLEASAQGKLDEKTRIGLADALAKSSERPAYVSQGAIASIRLHGKPDTDGTTISSKTAEQLAAEAIKNNTYSVDKIANGDREELDYVAGIAETVGTADDRKQLATNANTALNDPRYSGKINKNVTEVKKLAALAPVAPTSGEQGARSTPEKTRFGQGQGIQEEIFNAEEVSGDHPPDPKDTKGQGTLF